MIHTLRKIMVIFALCELLFCGCSPKAPVENGDLSFDLSGTFDELPLSSLVDSISYVKFEVTEESLIGRIHRLLLANNKYFIHDFSSKSIMVFDLNGKYLYKLSKYGQGPGEYITIGSFCTDKEDNIYIMDITLKCILKYNSRGEFVETMCKIEDFPRSDMAYIDGKFLLCMPDNNGNHRRGVFLLNPSTNEYTQIAKTENKDDCILLQFYFQKCGSDDSEYFALNNYDDLFYRIKGNKVISTKKITFTPKMNPETKEGYGLVFCIDTQKWNVILAASFEGSNFIFYNKETGEYKICNTKKLKNDIDGNAIGFAQPIVSGNSIVTIIGESEDSENSGLQILHLK